ncbi:MAG: twin-arginine translocase TatA/TatE family subunit [Deltaproteobacteria bacterium]|nr:twin-arginine translocase TatA/TatE family subunit [Deltaproteobacteria bacterium]
MFGMGGTEIIVILIVALLFLGPDKLPQAAKTISKGIRDIKRQSRALQNQIEGDEQIGGAIRDLKSAMRGEEAPVRPKPLKPLPSTEVTPQPALPEPVLSTGQPATVEPAATPADLAVVPTVTLPPMAGEPDPDVIDGGDEDLGSLIRPVEGTIAKGSEPKHG